MTLTLIFWVTNGGLPVLDHSLPQFLYQTLNMTIQPLCGGKLFEVMKNIFQFTIANIN